MKISNLIAVIFITLFLSSNSNACTFNTDCAVGSTCLKASGALYGICVGGLFPGNDNDNQPVYDPLDLDGTYGNTCSFDLDCGISNKCIKEQGQLYGTCI
jgi:hypothetical protein